MTAPGQARQHHPPAGSAQTQRWPPWDGPDAAPLRRCAALIVIGGLRMVLLWLGDILLAYGIAGPALPALRRCDPGRDPPYRRLRAAAHAFRPARPCP
nr:hypothetical protein GCM10020093_001430 [Planobispora longispora]